MKEIKIKPRTQLAIGAGIVGGLGALIAAQLPEIRRYLSIRSM